MATRKCQKATPKGIFTTPMGLVDPPCGSYGPYGLKNKLRSTQKYYFWHPSADNGTVGVSGHSQSFVAIRKWQKATPKGIFTTPMGPGRPHVGHMGPKTSSDPPKSTISAPKLGPYGPHGGSTRTHRGSKNSLGGCLLPFSSGHTRLQVATLAYCAAWVPK